MLVGQRTHLVLCLYSSYILHLSELFVLLFSSCCTSYDNLPAPLCGGELNFHTDNIERKNCTAVCRVPSVTVQRPRSASLPVTMKGEKRYVRPPSGE